MTSIRKWERDRQENPTSFPFSIPLYTEQVSNSKNWKELLIFGLKDNLKLLEQDYVIAKNNITNKWITASEMIESIENDDESINDFYEDVLSTTIRIMQLRCKKEINLENA